MPRCEAIVSAFVLPRPWAEHRAYVDHRQNVLKLLNGIKIDGKQFDPESRIGQCSFSIRKPSSDEIVFLESKVMRAGVKNSIVVDLISDDFSIQKTAEDIRSINSQTLDAEDVPQFAKYAIGNELSSILNGCISIWNICYSGCLNSIWHIAVVDGEIVDFGDRCEFRTLWALTDNHEIADLLNVKISPIEALEWSIGCSGFWRGQAETRIQRATACLMRTFSNRTAGMDTYGTLMWSLAGLEALYCNNESSIKYQIRNRAPLVVERYRIKDLDKNISKGYDFRSRLFHGDIPIRSPLADYDDDYQDKRHHRRQADEYANFFCLLLTCSVTAAIEEKSQDIFFNETCQFS
jgi:hypothetical protein